MTEPRIRAVYQERSFSEAEKRGIVEFVNNSLKTTINTSSEEIFEVVKSGVLLCKLIDNIEPGTVVGKINEEPKNQFEMNENLDKVIKASKKLGCNIVNIGPNDFFENRKHLVLGIFWQIVRVGLLKNVADLSAKINTQVALGLPPEQILLLWINHHLKTAGKNRVATNFGDDLKDGEILTYVLNQLDPNVCDLSPLQLSDPEERAEAVLSHADKLGCRKFVTPEDISKGNARVNLAFVATLFSKYPEMGISGKTLEITEENNRLKIMIEELSKTKSDLEEKYQQDKEQFLAISETEKNLREEVTNLKEDLKVEKEVVKSKSETEQNLRSEITDLREEITKLTEENQSKTEIEKNLREEITNLKEDLKVEKEEVKAKSETEQNLRSEITDLLNKLNMENQLKLETEQKLKDEITELNEKLKAEKEAKSELEQKLREEISKLTESLKTERQSKIESDESNSRKIHALQEELATEIAQKMEMESSFERERDALIDKNNELSDKLAAALQRIKELEAEIKTLKDKIAYLEQELNSSKQSSNKLTAEHNALKEELAQTQQKLAISKETIKDQQKEIATLYVELGDIKNELLKSVDALSLLEGQKATITRLLESDQKVGYLHKKSPNTKLGIKLQKRYFVLRGENLYYYKTDKDYNAINRAHPLGVIPLDNIILSIYTDEQCKKEMGTLNGFEIQQFISEKARRVIILSAANEEEKLAWCDIINKTTGVAQARNQTAKKHGGVSKIAETTLSRLKSLGAFQRTTKNMVESDKENSLSGSTVLEVEETTTATTTTTSPRKDNSSTPSLDDFSKKKVPSSWNIRPQEQTKWSVRAPKKSDDSEIISNSSDKEFENKSETELSGSGTVSIEKSDDGTSTTTTTATTTTNTESSSENTELAPPVKTTSRGWAKPVLNKRDRK